MNAAEAWLRERLPDAPPRLLAAMTDALPPDETGIPEALAEAALGILSRLGSLDGGRPDALPLLAADALLTHAFEAQAERDPAGIAVLAERFGGAGRLGALAETDPRG